MNDSERWKMFDTQLETQFFSAKIAPFVNSCPGFMNTWKIPWVFCTIEWFETINLTFFYFQNSTDLKIPNLNFWKLFGMFDIEAEIIVVGKNPCKSTK